MADLKMIGESIRVRRAARPGVEVGRGEDRSGQSRGELVAEFALMRRAQ